MKTTSILYLTPDLIGPPGGIARYCRMVCLALAESGIRMKVISLLDQSGASVEVAEQFPTLSYFPCRGSRPRLVARSLLEVLRCRPSLILVGHPNFSVLGWVLARLCRAKCAVFMYGTDVWQPLKGLRRRALQQADQAIAISHFTAQRAVESNEIHSDKIRILPNCLDPKLSIQPSAYSGRKATQSAPSLLTVSRITLFEPYKGHEYVIKAMPQLLQSFPNLIYNVVGDGDRRPHLQVLAEQEQVSHAVHFHGVVSDEELTRLYAEAWVFVMPSQVEGFGFVFLEAMAQGTPAIGGKTDAAGEVIADGETGFLVDPTSPDEIAHAVTKILQDDDLRAQMGRNSADRAHTKFHFRSFQRDLLNHLRELLPGRL